MTLPPLPALVREIENCITARHLDAALALCSNLRAAIAAVPAQPSYQHSPRDDYESGDSFAGMCESAQPVQPVQQPGAEPLQGGMDNAELLAAWKKKLPGVEPSDAQLTAFAVGVEVGFSHARDLERQDWSRVHHALAKHGVHPGRTDDHLADVIDRALAAPAQRQPLPPGLRLAAAFTRADLGPDGSNYPHVRELLAFAEQALGITAAPAAQKGKKL